MSIDKDNTIVQIQQDLRKHSSCTGHQSGVRTIKVDIKKSDTFDHYVKRFYRNLELANRGNDLHFTEEEFSLYIDYLLEARVNYCAGERSIKLNDFSVRMPVFVYFLLAQIGECENIQQGVVLVPSKFERHEGMTLTDHKEIREFIVDIGRLIHFVAPKAVAKSFPTKRTGNLDFMMFTHISSELEEGESQDYIHHHDGSIDEGLVSAASALRMTRMSSILHSHLNYGPSSGYLHDMYYAASIGILDS